MTVFHKQSRILLCSNGGPQEKNLGNFIFVICDSGHHAGARAQFWHRFPRGTASYVCKTMAYWGTFRGPTIIFRKLGFLQPQLVCFHSALPSFWAERCSSPCIIAGCLLLIQTVEQLLRSTRELLFYCNMTETRILTINKQIWITRNQQMKMHKLARQISASRDHKPTAQKQLNLLTQRIPDSGSEQGSSHVQNSGSPAEPSFVRHISAAATTPPRVTNRPVNSPSACTLTSEPGRAIWVGTEWYPHTSQCLWTAGSVPHSYRHRPKWNLGQSQALFNYSSCLQLKSGTRYVGTDNEPVSQISDAHQPWWLQRKAVSESRKSKHENKRRIPHKYRV